MNPFEKATQLMIFDTKVARGKAQMRREDPNATFILVAHPDLHEFFGDRERFCNCPLVYSSMAIPKSLNLIKKEPMLIEGSDRLWYEKRLYKGKHFKEEEK